MSHKEEDNAARWLAWGAEAFEKARKENKLLLVSIGYPACRGLVLMERESFSSPKFLEAAKSSFVLVKLDRELFPSVDFVYMAAAIAIRKEGGWPNNMIVTPELDPVISVGYGKEKDMARLLQDVANIWRTSPDQIRAHAAHISNVIKIHLETVDLTKAERDPDMEKIRESMDMTNGGFGKGAKFPMASALDFLLTEGNDDGFVKLSLDKMASGGMFDHVGGGFFRCTIDAKWEKPQYEKLLYDNALLASLYAKGAMVFDDKIYNYTTQKTLDFMERALFIGNGGGIAGSIIDCGKEDGAYYTWTYEEAQKIVSDPQALANYGITEKGNILVIDMMSGTPKISYTKKSIPRRQGDLLYSSDLEKLRQARETRTEVRIDQKVIAAWQGMAISAFAKGSVLLDNPRYLEVALREADFALSKIGQAHYIRNGLAQGRGNLEDGAFLAMGFWDLFEATGEEKWLGACRDAVDATKKKFATGDGGYYMVEDSEFLIARPRNYEDQPYTSAAALLGRVDWRLSFALGEPERATDSANTALNLMLSLNGGGMLGGEAMSLHREVFSPTVEILYSFAEGEKEKTRWIKSGHSRKWGIVRIPLGAASLNRVLSFGRKPVEFSRAFVCHNRSCEPPVDSPEDLETLLKRIETE
ncbi:MAG: DUF255 domain-containing protein [Nitrospinota bacterium]|nr:DUF255 domain-containing protein [Nitrospinota bacterium]